MLSVVALHASGLDHGAPFSPTDTVLLLLMLLAIPMIPYVIFYLTLEREKTQAPTTRMFAHPIAKMFAWAHAHRHPHLLHH